MIRIKEFKWNKITSCGLPHEVTANLLEVDILAKKNGWTILKFHPNNYILNLQRGEVKMNVYLSTFTIQTSMDHPRAGKTQLNRRNLNKKERELVFANPRTHTKKGYHNK